MIKLPIVLVASVFLVTPALAQVGNEHPVTSITIGPPSPITSGGGIERAIALCDRHIDQDLTLVNCPSDKLCNAHYAWPECYAINDAYRPTAKKLQEQATAEKKAQDETDHVFVQGIAKTLKCTPATCAGTSGDVGPYLPIIQPPGISMPVSPSSPCCTFSQSITIPRSLNGTSGIIGTTSDAIIVNDGSSPHGDKRNAADLKRAYDYCEKYLHVQFCDTVCSSIPNQYADSNCNVIQSLWLSSDWKKQDEIRDKKAEQDAIDHAKAFVAAVMRQKP